MEFMSTWSLRKKLLTGCYSLIAAALIIQLAATLMSNSSLVAWSVQAVITLVVAYPLIRILNGLLTDSIEQMTRAAMNVAKGDFSQKVHVQSNDAIGELGKALNQMVEKLRGILGDTVDISRQVADTSRDINLKSQGLKDALSQVTGATNELAVGANSISEDVGDMTETVKDIENKVASYSDSTKSMNRRSEDMIVLVEKGKIAVESQGVGMESNIEATRAVATTIEQLAKQAGGITKITFTIKDIAEQTNLLSLNASIEAARAGEHGQGFAVVAQEVRKLAEEATRATKEVFQLVRGIEECVKEAIDNIRTNEDIVLTQKEALRQTSDVFNEIVGNIQYISERIEQFSSESDVMLEGARKISAAIENISAITQQSAAGTEQVSASMNEQIPAVQAMAQQTERMAQSVGQLQKTIQIFKL